MVVVVIDAPFRSKESRLQQSTTDMMVVCNIQPYLFIYQRTELKTNRAKEAELKEIEA